MPISKKWRNYIKFLISETGNRVDELSTVVGFDIRESISELESKNAQYITTMLKQEKLWLERGKAAPLPDAAFEIETSYNTTMEAGTEKDLLNWASKRFKRDLPSLKKIKAFAVDNKSAIVDVPGYKIRRSYHDS